MFSFSIVCHNYMYYSLNNLLLTAYLVLFSVSAFLRYQAMRCSLVVRTLSVAICTSLFDYCDAFQTDNSLSSQAHACILVLSFLYV